MIAQILALVLVVLASGPATDKNWMRHPEIKKVRKLFKAIQADIKSGKIKCQKTSPDSEERPYDRELELCADGSGVVRKYTSTPAASGSGRSKRRSRDPATPSRPPGPRPT